MNSVVISHLPRPSVEAWHELFLVHVLPVVEELSSFRFRNLPQVEQEESTAEAVAGALVSFVRLTQRGRKPQEFASRLARFAVLRVLSGRLSSCPDRNRDVLSRLGKQRRGISVQSLDSDKILTRNGWQEILVEDRRSTPAEVATSRLDIRAWLDGMTARRRQIAEALAAGFRTDEVAELFHLSHGRISQLRREFESSWQKFQAEDVTAATHRQHAAA